MASTTGALALARFGGAISEVEEVFVLMARLALTGATSEPLCSASERSR